MNDSPRNLVDMGIWTAVCTWTPSNIITDISESSTCIFESSKRAHLTLRELFDVLVFLPRESQPDAVAFHSLLQGHLVDVPVRDDYISANEFGRERAKFLQKAQRAFEKYKVCRRKMMKKVTDPGVDDKYEVLREQLEEHWHAAPVKKVPSPPP